MNHINDNVDLTQTYFETAGIDVLDYLKFRTSRLEEANIFSTSSDAKSLKNLTNKIDDSEVRVYDADNLYDIE